MAAAFEPTYKVVETDGAKLHVWHQGSGRLLILIAGGAQSGICFDAVIPKLSQHYTVATYDRRGYSNSLIEKKTIVNLAQSARDVVAIIKALGFQKASIFGTSAGGIIALQLGVSYPEHIEHLIAHESPTTSLLPDTTTWLDFCASVYDKYKTNGGEAAIRYFGSKMVGMDPTEPIAATTLDNAPFFFEYEYTVFTIYTPNMPKLRDNGVSMAVVAGEKSKDAYYARTTAVQAEMLGCPRIMWPGAHTVYKTSPDAFVRALLDTLRQLGVNPNRRLSMKQRVPSFANDRKEFLPLELLL